MSLEDWLNNHWLHTHETSAEEIQALLHSAEEDIGSAEIKGIAPGWRLNMAYTAALRYARAALYACGYRPGREREHERTKTLGVWPFVFVWMSMVGMALGLTGEILWFIRLNEIIFRCAMVIMTLSLTLGAISLWPWAGILPSTARTDFGRNESALKLMEAI